MSPVILHAYTGDPPATRELADRLGVVLNQCTYFTANAAMEKSRQESGVGPSRQRDADGARLVFARAIRLLSGGFPLTRTEERVLLRRAVDGHGFEADRDRLRADAADWVEALAEVAAEGRSPHDPQLEGECVTPRVAELLGELADASERLRRKVVPQRRRVEDVVNDWLDGFPDFRDAVVLEGFTFLTPLQQRLIDVASLHVPVHLVFPFDERHPEMFRNIPAVYEKWWPPGGPERWETPVAAAGSLAGLQTTLFRRSGPDAAQDGSVTVHSYAHVHDEVRAGMRTLRQHLDSGYPAGDIAIVVPRRQEYDTLLREEATLAALPVSLGIPPRLLLLTPVGRFVLSLYEAFQDGELRLTAEQFEVMLSSGWLGALAQRSVQEFRAVRAQLFDACTQVTQWRDVLSSLAERSRTTGSTDIPSRIPADWCDPKHVTVWHQAIDRIVALSVRLFEPGERSIGDHVRGLLETLDELPTDQVFDREREIIERVKEALRETVGAGTLGLRADEFGEVLTSLAAEYEDATSTEEDTLKQTGSIWVTTPEGIDGVRRPVVVLLGADDRRLPRPFPSPWPRARDDVSAHLDRERYMFGAVVRGATRRLHVSYARRALDGPALPSPFVVEAGLPIQAEESATSAPAASPPPESEPVPYRRDHYTLNELAHFGLCPHRYKLERIDPASRRYTSPIQVPVLAQARWIHLSLTLLEHAGQLPVKAVKERLGEAMGSVENEIRDEFPALRALDWRATRTWTTTNMAKLAKFLARNNYPVTFLPARAIPVEVVRDDQLSVVIVAVRHVYRKGVLENSVNSDVLYEEWLYPAEAPPQGLQLDEFEGLRLFRDRQTALDWWRTAVYVAYAAANTGGQLTARQHNARRLNDIRAVLRLLIDGVEAGRYPRRPGDHCSHCPVLDDCLGLNP